MFNYCIFIFTAIVNFISQFWHDIKHPITFNLYMKPRCTDNLDKYVDELDKYVDEFDKEE